MKARSIVEFGDFQTPLALAQAACSLLVQGGVTASTVIEPTCGVGAFLVAAAAAFPHARLLGWDINPEYVAHSRLAIQFAGADRRATVEQ